MLRVLMKHMSLNGWNEKNMKENDLDKAGGMNVTKYDVTTRHAIKFVNQQSLNQSKKSNFIPRSFRLPSILYN